MAKAQTTERRQAATLRPSTALPARKDALDDLDTQLMLQVRDGNAEAANMLIRRNFDRVARYIFRVVRDQRAVEDLSQEVFLQVWLHADRYQPTARFSTWLYRIATNSALNYVNQAFVRRRTADGVDAEHDVPDRRSAAGPDRRMNLDELKQRVSRAVADLPIKQRIALTLFEYEELSYPQIASVLEVTVEAVRCLLSRARSTLRRRLAGLA